MRAGAHRLQDPLLALLGVDPLDLVARRHDLADPALAEGKDALHRLLLRLADQAGLAARLDQEVQLGRRVLAALAVARLQAAQAQDPVAEPVEEQDRGAEHQEEQAERPDHRQGRALAALEGEALRRELRPERCAGP